MWEYLYVTDYRYKNMSCIFVRFPPIFENILIYCGEFEMIIKLK